MRSKAWCTNNLPSYTAATCSIHLLWTRCGRATHQLDKEDDTAPLCEHGQPCEKGLSSESGSYVWSTRLRTLPPVALGAAALLLPSDMVRLATTFRPDLCRSIVTDWCGTHELVEGELRR
jgi:hypothetical protein